MSTIFLISDTHFGHNNLIEKHNQRPRFKTIEEHDEYIVQQWNDTVSDRDTIIHLGDVCFGLKSFDTLKRLNGIKRLVLGNHDQYPSARYLEHFTKIMGSMKIDSNLIATHIPVHPSEFPRYKANIHGHKHDRLMNDPRYFCVSLEQIDYKPIALDEVIKRINLNQTV